MAKDTVSATDTFILPLSGKEVVLRGMTGKEEDYLTDRALVKSGKALDKVIHGCTITINGVEPSEESIEKLKTPDRTFMLVKIRSMSLGEIVENVEVVCQQRNCGAVETFDVNLSELPIIPPKVAENETVIVTLSDGTKAKLKYMDSKDETKLMKAGELDMLTTAVLVRLAEVDGVHPNSHKSWLKALPVKDRMMLRNALEEMECGLDTTITIVCDECKAKNKIRVESTKAFFFPGT